MSMVTPWNDLANSLKVLRESWEQTKEVWNDPVQKDFEEHHWLVMDAQVTDTLRGMDRLAQVIAQLKRECSESDRFFV